MNRTDSLDHKFQTTYEDAINARSQGNLAAAVEEFGNALKLAELFEEKDERRYNSLVGLARCHYRLGDHDLAEMRYREALSFMEKHLKEEQPGRFASILWELAILYSDAERFTEARRFFEKSISITEKHSGQQDRFVADCLWGLSKCFCASGELDKAIEAIKRAVSIYELSKEESMDLILTNLSNLAAILLQQQRFSEASDAIFQMIEMYESLSSLPSGELVNLNCQLAWCLKKLRRYRDAERHLKLAKKSSKLLLEDADEDEKTEIRKQEALIDVALAHNFNCMNKYDKAEVLLQKAIKKLRSFCPKTGDSELAGALYELVLCYVEQSMFIKAKPVLFELLELHETSPLSNPEMFADTLFQLATVSEELQDFRKAAKYYRRSLDIREKIYGPQHEEVVLCLIQLAECLRKIGDSAEATLIQRQADGVINILKTRS